MTSITEMYNSLKSKNLHEQLWEGLISDLPDKPVYKRLKAKIQSIIIKKMTDADKVVEAQGEEVGESTRRTAVAELCIMAHTVDTIVMELLYRALKSRMYSIVEQSVADVIEERKEVENSSSTGKPSTSMLENIESIIDGDKKATDVDSQKIFPKQENISPSAVRIISPTKISIKNPFVVLNKIPNIAEHMKEKTITRVPTSLNDSRKQSIASDKAPASPSLSSPIKTSALNKEKGDAISPLKKVLSTDEKNVFAEVDSMSPAKSFVLDDVIGDLTESDWEFSSVNTSDLSSYEDDVSLSEDDSRIKVPLKTAQIYAEGCSKTPKISSPSSLLEKTSDKGNGSPSKSLSSSGQPKQLPQRIRKPNSKYRSDTVISMVGRSPGTNKNEFHDSSSDEDERLNLSCTPLKKSRIEQFKPENSTVKPNSVDSVIKKKRGRPKKTSNVHDSSIGETNSPHLKISHREIEIPSMKTENTFAGIPRSSATPIVKSPPFVHKRKANPPRKIILESVETKTSIPPVNQASPVGHDRSVGQEATPVSSQGNSPVNYDSQQRIPKSSIENRPKAATITKPISLLEQKVQFLKDGTYQKQKINKNSKSDDSCGTSKAIPDGLLVDSKSVSITEPLSDSLEKVSNESQEKKKEKSPICESPLKVAGDAAKSTTPSKKMFNSPNKESSVSPQKRKAGRPRKPILNSGSNATQDTSKEKSSVSSPGPADVNVTKSVTSTRETSSSSNILSSSPLKKNKVGRPKKTSLLSKEPVTNQVSSVKHDDVSTDKKIAEKAPSVAVHSNKNSSSDSSCKSESSRTKRTVNLETTNSLRSSKAMTISSSENRHILNDKFKTREKSLSVDDSATDDLEKIGVKRVHSEDEEVDIETVDPESSKENVSLHVLSSDTVEENGARNSLPTQKELDSSIGSSDLGPKRKKGRPRKSSSIALKNNSTLPPQNTEVSNGSLPTVEDSDRIAGNVRKSVSFSEKRLYSSEEQSCDPLQKHKLGRPRKTAPTDTRSSDIVISNENTPSRVKRQKVEKSEGKSSSQHYETSDLYKPRFAYLMKSS